ncbi:MAG: hypothetical protein JWO40_878 [Candidatus Doudnabacteria bacterium]|nr:hypothetical protein [Candidatus Doudnabacteria bacterium]
MFLKSLIISSKGNNIREIIFRKGLNLIVDETPEISGKTTGNNVGKTTVLKLIDFCLGADPKNVYIDPESRKDNYDLVKNYLIDKHILITLVLKENLDLENSFEIVIERNFLARKNKILKVNQENLTEDEFEQKLLQLIIPGHNEEKPTFRQIISHNIRYKDESVSNTLKTLDRYTTDIEYESLYLFLFGCKFTKGDSKQLISEKLKQETTYKSRLERQQTKTAYQAALNIINSEIEDLNNKKADLNINPNFENDLDKLNVIKYEINKTSSEISKFTIRKNLIIEAEQELDAKKSVIDLVQLRSIYQQATEQIRGIQKTFDDLVNYHNQMIFEKVKFIKKELPTIEKSIREKQINLKEQLREEEVLTSSISKSDSFEALESLIAELTEKFRKKGEYESIIKQLIEVEKNIGEYTAQLDEINDELFSGDFEQKVKDQLDKFNIIFASISNQLYGEPYAIKHDIITNTKNQRLYKFSAFNTNLSSGKKQGEISCFDLAYTLFADEERIPCLHFLLNDKKELMHDNQLVRIANFVSNKNIQFVASMLRDKLPEELNQENYFVVKLSQQDKLFRIEENNQI